MIHLFLYPKLLVSPKETSLLFSQLEKLLLKYILKVIKYPLYPFLNELLVIMLKSKRANWL